MKKNDNLIFMMLAGVALGLYMAVLWAHSGTVFEMMSVGADYPAKAKSANTAFNVGLILLLAFNVVLIIWLVNLRSRLRQEQTVGPDSPARPERKGGDDGKKSAETSTKIAALLK